MLSSCSHRLAALAEGAQTAPLGESYWAVRRLLEALARTQPVLLVLDDVHWAEPALVDLVDYLADRADAPLLVLCLARPELDRPLGEPLALGPLGEDEARAIVAGTAEVDEETRERIVELAEGNALYAEQLASFAADGGEGLPPTLEAVLAGRLGRLDAAERSVLQRAAVVGREFSLGPSPRSPTARSRPSLLSLSRAGFVHPAAAADPGDDGYTFHHVLLRDAAYASLTKADRADLHERAAAWLDRDGPGDDAIAGYHLEQACATGASSARTRTSSPQPRASGSVRPGCGSGGRTTSTLRSSLLGRATALLPAGPAAPRCCWSTRSRSRFRERRQCGRKRWTSCEADARATRSAPCIAPGRSGACRHRTAQRGDLELDVAIADPRGVRSRRCAREADERGLGERS